MCIPYSYYVCTKLPKLDFFYFAQILNNKILHKNIFPCNLEWETIEKSHVLSIR